MSPDAGVSTAAVPGSTRISAVGRGYARALMAVAGDAAGALAEMEAVCRAIRSQDGFLALVSSQAIPLDDRRGAVERCFASSVSAPVMSLLGDLVSRGHIARVFEVAQALAELVHGGSEVAVASARPMAAAESSALEAAVRASFAGVRGFTYTVDERLIEGLTLKLGDRVIDASTASRLRQMTAALNGD